MIVVFTDPAEEDLEQIGDWIARNNPIRAGTFIRELRQACRTLDELPLGHALVSRYEHTGIRRRVYGNYLIFYWVVGDEIQVLHILHGARDFEAILFPEG